MTESLHPTVVAKIEQEFALDDRPKVSRLLSSYGKSPMEPMRDRVHMAILHLAEGKLDAINHHLRIAKLDFRDVLSPAARKSSSN